MGSWSYDLKLQKYTYHQIVKSCKRARNINMIKWMLIYEGMETSPQILKKTLFAVG